MNLKWSLNARIETVKRSPDFTIVLIIFVLQVLWEYLAHSLYVKIEFRSKLMGA